MEKWRSRVGSLPVCINKATGHPRALKKLRLSGGSYLDRLLSNTCENFRLISISMHLAAISTFFPHFMFVTLGGKVSSVRRWGAYNFERRCHLLPHDVKNQFWWVFFLFLVVLRFRSHAYDFPMSGFYYFDHCSGRSQGSTILLSLSRLYVHASSSVRKQERRSKEERLACIKRIYISMHKKQERAPKNKIK